MKTIAFAGGSSLLAQSWTIKKDHKVDFIFGTHRRKLSKTKSKKFAFNYENFDELSKELNDLKVNIVINCIGLTSVEECEKNYELAYNANVIIAGNIAKACHLSKIKLVHISTDHLFEGSSAFKNEKDSKLPLNNYAKTKSKGEDIILENCPEALIIRTNFFGLGPNYKPSFSDKILRDLERGKNLNLFNDVFYTPVSVETLKEQVYRLLEKNAKGIFNISSNERLTKYQFGLLLAKKFGYNKDLINPISINKISNLTRRPKDMSLCNHKLSSFLDISVSPIEEQLEAIKLDKIKNKKRMVIPYGRQDISKKDIESVVNILKSDYITQGPTTIKFENRVADYCKVKYAHSTNSATSALHVACLSLGVGKGDLVWTSPISFVASSNCALYCNADVDFVDIDQTSYNMSPAALEKKLIEAKSNGRLPKVVIPVHLSGQSCEMDKIHYLSKIYGFKIIEDASHSIGSFYKGKPVGNCEFSDIAVFSFHPVKIITTCEGGMCLTNDPELSNLIARFRSHGITRQASEMSKTPDGPWYYEQLNLGLNYRMNDVQSALGLSQMERLDEFVEKRRKIAEIYDDLLKTPIIQTPKQHPDTKSSWHLYIIRLKKNTNFTHKQLFENFRSAGVLVNIHYIPIYRQPYYKKLGFTKQGFSESEKYYKEAISLPIFPELTFKEQKRVVDLIKQPIGFQNLF